VPKVPFSILETSVRSHGFLIIYVAIHAFSPTSLFQRPEKGVTPGKPNDERSGAPFFKTLGAIFLDTECLLNMDEVPTKVPPFFSMHV
jgi:hypothetical protein